MAGTKDGEWLIPGLSPGTVTVTATLEGMETATVEGVRVSISGVASVNLTMRPAAVEEAITVTSEAPVLDVTSSSASVTFDQELVDLKPTTTRNFQELALMAPGVNLSGRLGNVGAYAGHPTAYGRDQASISWNVDGLDGSFPGAFSREFEEVPYWRVGFQSVLGSNTVIEANFSDTINNRRTCSIPPSSFPPLSRSLAVFRKAMSVAGSSATTTSCPRSLSTVRYG